MKERLVSQSKGFTEKMINTMFKGLRVVGCVAVFVLAWKAIWWLIFL